MKFLNKKEQVIDLQLTQHGKYLLSQGKLKPVYYAFYDDNILYDGRHVDISGTQNSIQQRIISDTPQLEAQYVFHGVETEVARLNYYIRSSEEEKRIVREQDIKPPPLQQTKDKHYGLQYPIGTSRLNTEYAPSWDITFLEGHITSSATRLTGNYNNINIPQITPNTISYKTIVKQLSEPELGEFGDLSENIFGNTFIDTIPGDDSIILEVKEENAFFGNNNFEIEVYEIQEEKVYSKIGSGFKTKEILIPLYFTKQENFIKNNILLDEEEYDEFDVTEEGESGSDPSYVDYFLDISVDKEIDPNILCNITVDRTQGIFSTKLLECEEELGKKEVNTKNIFDTDVTDEDFEGC